MATITRYPFLRHLRGGATTHVRHLVAGQVKHAGVGVSFWFRPLTAVLSEVPMDDRELPVTIHGRTGDLQQVSVNVTVTFRFADPDLAAARVDFTIDPTTGAWQALPLEQVATVLGETATGHALAVIAALDLDTALRNGPALVRDALTTGLRADARLAETGISVLGVRVAMVRPSPELEKALQTPTREQLQQEADRATFERRARAVEHEAAIGENELANQIALAVKQERLVEQRGTNARREATENAAAQAITTEAQAAMAERLASADAAGKRAVGAVETDIEAARLAAYRDLPQQVLLALALKELAGQLPNIDHLTVTPDVLTDLVARFAGERR